MEKRIFDPRNLTPTIKPQYLQAVIHTMQGYIFGSPFDIKPITVVGENPSYVIAGSERACGAYLMENKGARGYQIEDGDDGFVNLLGQQGITLDDELAALTSVHDLIEEAKKRAEANGFGKGDWEKYMKDAARCVIKYEK